MTRTLLTLCLAISLLATGTPATAEPDAPVLLDLRRARRLDARAFHRACDALPGIYRKSEAGDLRICEYNGMTIFADYANGSKRGVRATATGQTFPNGPNLMETLASAVLLYGRPYLIESPEEQEHGHWRWYWKNINSQFEELLIEITPTEFRVIVGDQSP